MCVLSIKEPIRKKSGNLFNDPYSNSRNHLIVCKGMTSDSFKNNLTYKQFIYKSYIFDIYV